MSSYSESAPTAIIVANPSLPGGSGSGEGSGSPTPFPTGGPVYVPSVGSGGGGGIDLTNWRIILTDLNSVPIAEISDDAIEPSMTEVYNGIDRGSFTLNLESQAAYACVPVKTLIKIWRDVPGYTPFPDGLPWMVGIITSRTRNAAERTATYNWQSPFWRLTSRYHVDAHDFSWETGRGLVGVNTAGSWHSEYNNPANPGLYSVINDETGAAADGWYLTEAAADGAAAAMTQVHGGVDPTEIMWQMIDWTNQVVQYTQGDRTGIRVFSPAAKADYFGADPSVLINARYSVGQNTWDLISDIVSLPGFPDLSPTYIHEEGSPELVWFNTVRKKGTTRAFSFDYRTGNKNLDDITDNTVAEAGEYANYVVVQGQGDKSTGSYDPATGFSGLDQTIARADGTSTASTDLGLPDLISEHGLYMHFERDDNQLSNLGRYKKATYILGRMAYPPTSYEIKPSMAFTWGYPYEFRAGDTVTLNCDRDSMQFSGVPVLITEATVKRTKNKMEELSLTVVDPDSYKAFDV